MKTYFATIKNFFKHSAFWEKWGGWILATILLILLMTQGGFINGMKAGWYEKNDGLELTFMPFLSLTFSALLAIIAFFFLLWLLATVYHATIHYIFFTKLNIGMVIAYFIFLFLFVDQVPVMICKLLVKKNDDTLNNITMITAFILLYCIAYSFIKDFYKKQKEQAKLLQQKTEAELRALKAQINPHFLFNSLNNIYGTAMVEDAPQTAGSLQQLSGIMRYVLEKSTIQKVSIADEIKFLNDYTYMHELRIAKRDNIKIDIKIDWDEQPADIAPLLLNPIIENAFKYGISVDQPCFVNIDFEVNNGKLRFNTKNSILPTHTLEKGTGTGLDNVRQRLALAYPNRHSLVIREAEGIFEVKLEMEL